MAGTHNTVVRVALPLLKHSIGCHLDPTTVFNGCCTKAFTQLLHNILTCVMQNLVVTVDYIHEGLASVCRVESLAQTASL